MSIKESEELLALVNKESLTKEEEKRLETLQWEYKSAKINEFLKEFIHPVLPQLEHLGHFTTSNPRTIHRHAELSMPLGNDSFKDSKYQLKLDKNQYLLHYTSLPVLMNIVREGKIRLYSMNHMTDPGELIHAAQIMGYSKEQMEELRTQLFSMSFVLFDNVNQEEFDHWRLYGQDGNGVGIVFSVDDQDIDEWYNFHLSKVYYDNHDENPFNKKLNQLEEWQRQEGFTIRNTHKVFAKLHAFYKSSIFTSEKEVRLLRHIKHNYSDYGRDLKSEWDIYFDFNRQGNESYFTELELGKTYEKKYQKFTDEFMIDAHKQYPKLKIEKIILGYGKSWSNHFDKVETLRKQAQLTLGYSFEIQRSKYWEHFNS